MHQYSKVNFKIKPFFGQKQLDRPRYQSVSQVWHKCNVRILESFSTKAAFIGWLLTLIKPPSTQKVNESEPASDAKIQLIWNKEKIKQRHPSVYSATIYRPWNPNTYTQVLLHPSMYYMFVQRRYLDPSWGTRHELKSVITTWMRSFHHFMLSCIELYCTLSFHIQDDWTN